jgi:hypothetical protein
MDECLIFNFAEMSFIDSITAHSPLYLSRIYLAQKEFD